MSRTYHHSQEMQGPNSHSRGPMRPASFRTTIRVSALRQEEDQIAAMERYAMKRYTTSWAQRNYKMASVWFNAAERFARLGRIIAG